MMAPRSRGWSISGWAPPGGHHHADRLGAVVPANAVAALPALAERVMAREKVVIEACKRPDFNAEVLAAALEDSAEPH